MAFGPYAGWSSSELIKLIRNDEPGGVLMRDDSVVAETEPTEAPRYRPCEVVLGDSIISTKIDPLPVVTRGGVGGFEAAGVSTGVSGAAGSSTAFSSLLLSPLSVSRDVLSSSGDSFASVPSWAAMTSLSTGTDPGVSAAIVVSITGVSIVSASI